MYYFLFLIDGLGYSFLKCLKETQNENIYIKPIKNQRPSSTAPNWTSILTGLPVKKHKITNNESVRKRNFKFKHTSLFNDYCKRKNSTWFITDWKMMFKYVQCKKLGNRLRCTYTKKPFYMLKKNWSRQRPRPKLTVINTDRLDSIGHTKGCYSSSFKNQAIKIESFILNFSKYLHKKRVKFCIFVTADHGYWLKNHENYKNPKINTVPFVVICNDKTKFNSLKNQSKKNVHKTIHIRKYLKKNR